MGATRRSKSTRAPRRVSVKSANKQTKLYDVLDHLGKSLAIAETVARALEAPRINARLSQEELADRAGLDRTTPSLYERGPRQPTIATLISLREALGCDCALLLQRTVAEFRGKSS